MWNKDALEPDRWDPPWGVLLDPQVPAEQGPGLQREIAQLEELEASLILTRCLWAYLWNLLSPRPQQRPQA